MRDAPLNRAARRAAAIAAIALGGCASAPPALAPSHPARADAPAGRLAGVAPSLRAGVVTYPDVPALPTTVVPHHHHHDHAP